MLTLNIESLIKGQDSIYHVAAYDNLKTLLSGFLYSAVRPINGKKCRVGNYTFFHVLTWLFLWIINMQELKEIKVTKYISMWEVITKMTNKRSETIWCIFTSIWNVALVTHRKKLCVCALMIYWIHDFFWHSKKIVTTDFFQRNICITLLLYIFIICQKLYFIFCSFRKTVKMYNVDKWKMVNPWPI